MANRTLDNHCFICGNEHTPATPCPTHTNQTEPMDFSGRNPLVALAAAEGWQFPENDSDIMQALHQTTGTAFMREYVKRAMGEGVISPKTHKPFDALTTRELMRLFKTAYDRYGLIRTREDAPVPVNAGPRDNGAYMGNGGDAPQAATPQDGTKVRGYRKLSDDDIAQMNVFKAESRSFNREIAMYRAHLQAKLNGPEMLSAAQAKELNEALRWLAIARSDLQTACMAACRAVAKPEDDC